MIGDILVSADRSEATTDISFPTTSNARIESSNAITNLRQKIVQIGPGVLLGYAGYLSEAQSLIHFIQFDYNRERSGKTALDSFRQFFASSPDRYQTLECVIVIEDDDGTTIARKNCEQVSTFLFESVTVLGSGRTEFLNYLDQVRQPDRSAIQGSQPDGDKVAYIVEYVVSTLKHQRSSGFGIKDAWGGGFEMAFKRNGKYMEKIDNIFFHSYLVKEVNRDLQFIGEEERTFQYYFGEDLKIVVQPFGRNSKSFVVPPPVTGLTKRTSTYMTDRLANLVCVLMKEEITGRTYCFLEYNEKGNPFFAIRYLGEQDFGVDVRMWYVKSRFLVLRSPVKVDDRQN